MTIPVQDTCVVDGEPFAILRSQGVTLFDPTAHGFVPHGISTAEIYTRGFVVDADQLAMTFLRVLDAHGRYPALDGIAASLPDPRYPRAAREYVGLRIPQNFTGGFLLGDGLLDGRWDIFEPPASYERVLELVFECGRLTRRADHSTAVAQLRDRLGPVEARRWNAPLPLLLRW